MPLDNENGKYFFDNINDIDKQLISTSFFELIKKNIMDSKKAPYDIHDVITRLF